MRIAQIAPMYEPVPPPQYGGTERVVWSVTEELVRRGHEVTLFASGDSQTSARLEPTTPRAFRHWMTRREIVEVAPMLHLELFSQVYRRAAEFDIIHSHVHDLMASLAFGRLVATPTVTTLHGCFEEAWCRPVLSRFGDAPLVSISQSQRAPLAGLALNWVGCVHNGIPLERFPFQAQPGRYLAFLGRICPEKGIVEAVEVARRAGLPLRVAAKIDLYDRRYWHEVVEPLFAANNVEFLGEADDAQKAALLGGALATLLPITWSEPFGLVLAESLACGTPVLAFERGAVPEIIRDGRGGFICRSVDEMAAAVGRVAELDRAVCRAEAERFSAARMAADYEQVYQRLLRQRAVDA